VPEKEAVFRLKIEADAKTAVESTAALEDFRKAIDKSKTLIGQYAQTMRALRGSSDEVVSAKAQLKARIDAERDAISRNSLAILKLGTSYEQVAKKAKLTTESTKDVKAAISAAGGPVAELSGRFASLKEILGGANTGLALSTLAAAAALAAFVALGVAVVAAAISLGKFVLESANALRAMGLQREAVTGSADDAARMGRQVDLLATKLATPKEKLNELYISLRRTFDQSRVSGQGILDTFTAVASASAAAGDETGHALQEIIDAGKRAGRVGLNPQQLVGKGGPQFQDIAAALAKNLKVGLVAAEQMLLTYRVPIDAAAKAIKDAVETRFGALNAKKLLDIDVILAKFGENIQGLMKTLSESEGFQLFLSDLKSLGDYFSSTTASGQTMASALTTFGELIGVSFHAAVPSIISLLDRGLNAMLRFENGLLDLALAGDFDWISSAINKLPSFTTAMAVTKVAVVGLTASLVAMGIAAAIAFAPIVLAGVIAAEIYAIYSMLKDLDWSFLGQTLKKDLKSIWDESDLKEMIDIGYNMVMGLVEGIEKGWATLKSAVLGTAGKVKGWFTGPEGVDSHSPSRVFRHYGHTIPQGAAQGIVQGLPEVEQAAARMVVSATSSSGGAAAPGASSGTGSSAGGALAASAHPALHFTFNLPASSSSEETVARLREPSVLDMLTHAVEIGLRSSGIPTQSPAGA
jgi:hypothetical protein